MKVRVRFAPSPTGFLHIGGVRTALFNWLFAQQTNGTFLLRIDDTDEERNVSAALAPILHGLQWIGLQWDEGPMVGGPHEPYFQSQRKIAYQRAVEDLLRTGHAYRDYATPEEVEAERAEATRSGKVFRYSRAFAAFDENQRAMFESQGRSSVVRLKMPTEGELLLNDLVRGVISFPWAQEQDHVIQRKDGTFIYHLASVVDDCEFEITHILRAEEHLSNTPRQYFIANALGHPKVQYGHLPYVAEPGSKRKLSKRKLNQYLKTQEFRTIHTKGLKVAKYLGIHIDETQFNPVCIDFYEQLGFLPEAIINYLGLLGWSLDEQTEFFTLKELIRSFSIERIHASPASFDITKLVSVQAHHFRNLSDDQKAVGCTGFARRAGLQAPKGRTIDEHVAKVVALLGDRISIFGDILIIGRPYFLGLIENWDEKAFHRCLTDPNMGAALERFAEGVRRLDGLNLNTFERLLGESASGNGVEPGTLMLAIRVAVTGSSSGPGVLDIIDVLGPDLFQARVQEALARRGLPPSGDLEGGDESQVGGGE